MLRALRLVPIALGLATPILAQETIRPEMTVRLSTPNGVMVGRVLTSTVDLLTIDSAGRRAVTVPWASVRSVERRQTHASRWAGRGAIWGALLGAVYGTLVMSTNCQVPSCDDYVLPVAGAGAIGVGLVGAGLGGIVGATVPRWTPVAASGKP